MRLFLMCLAILCGSMFLFALVQVFVTRFRSRRRLFELANDETPAAQRTTDPEPNALQRWLFLAGFRTPQATFWFVATTAATLVLGLAAAGAIELSGLVTAADQALSVIPGGVADIFRPILYLAPWFFLASLALAPTLLVRRVRRARVLQVEQDLPVTLELLATLAEAGLGFDAAVGRIVTSQGSERPLTAEFRTLQFELLSGRQRIDCLRRVARRLEISGVTTFISALVQAEQVGAGIANVLRQQADDLRQRRRERATELSMKLPVKQMFPMVICFLPGIMLFTLGATFHEFFKYADTIIRLRHH